MSRIFISYKRVDKDKVIKIKDQIESALGEKCWIDLDCIESGDFSHIILDTIENSSIVLFFYGKDTEHSQWQRRELEYSKANGKTVIPILLADIPDDSWYRSYFEKFPVIKYADDRCAELILKEISNIHKCHPNAPAESTPKHTYSASYTKGCGYGCLIGLVVLIAMFLFYILNYSVPYSAGPAPYPSEASSPQSYEKPNSDKENQGFGKRYNVKDLTLLSDAELDREYAWTQTIEDSLYLFIGKDASASYDLREIHRYQLQIREEQITRRTDACAEDEQGQDNTGDYLYGDDSSEKESLHAWIWLAGLATVFFGAIPILLTRKKKKVNSQGKEVLPLFAQKKEIKIFIAGSTRLVSERDALRATISKMYNQYKSDNLVVEAYEFDDFTREFVEGGQQRLYDNFIRNEANWVVFITDGTIGDKTIWELENAIKIHKETGRPKILMYSIPQNITDNQKDQMSQFKSILNREDNYWIDYEDVNTIRSTFREHLEWDLINLMKQELRRVG